MDKKQAYQDVINWLKIARRKQAKAVMEYVAHREEEMAREAWEAARRVERIELGEGESIEGRHCEWSDFADWWQSRGRR